MQLSTQISYLGSVEAHTCDKILGSLSFCALIIVELTKETIIMKELLTRSRINRQCGHTHALLCTAHTPYFGPGRARLLLLQDKRYGVYEKKATFIRFRHTPKDLLSCCGAVTTFGIILSSQPNSRGLVDLLCLGRPCIFALLIRESRSVQLFGFVLDLCCRIVSSTVCLNPFCQYQAKKYQKLCLFCPLYLAGTKRQGLEDVVVF